MGPLQLLPFRDKVDMGVISTKGYTTFSKALVLEPHNQIV